MSDSYSDSLPFTLEDFEALEREHFEKPAFVGLFAHPEPEPVSDSEEFAESAESAEEAADEEPGSEAAEEQTEPVDEGPSLEDQIRKAFEDAYAQGEKAGYEMGMRRVESTAKRLEKQIEEVSTFKHELMRKCESLSVDLALAFTEALVLKECAEHKEVLVTMIRKALEACEDRNGLVIRMRSEDCKHIEGINSSHIKIIPDDTLKEPGFIIETNMGDIDGRISTQIEELKNGFAGYRTD